MNGLESMGQRVAFARKYRGMTQHEVSALSKIAQSSLASLESGRNKGCRKVVGLAKSLNVSAQWIYSGETNGKTVEEILLAGYSFNEFSSFNSLPSHVDRQSDLSKENAADGFDVKIGVKLLSWTTRSLLSPKTAYSKTIDDKRRFGMPCDYTDTAYLLQCPLVIKPIRINRGDHLLIEPEAIAKSGDLVIAIDNKENIILGKMLVLGSVSSVLVEFEFGKETILNVDDLFIAGVVKCIIGKM